MKKVYCDICGKEINKGNEAWVFGLNAKEGNPRVSFDETIEDICEHCATIMHCCVSMMKLTGWEPDFHEKLKSDSMWESDKAGYVLSDLEDETGLKLL